MSAKEFSVPKWRNCLPASECSLRQAGYTRPDVVGVNWIQNSASPVYGIWLAEWTMDIHKVQFMFTVYVLRSSKDLRLYIGMTDDVVARVAKHNKGGVPSTRYRRPLNLVYREKVPTRIEARNREKFLKSGPGHVFLKSVLMQQA